MNTNLLPQEDVALVAAIDPDAYAANTYTTPWIPAKNFSWFMAVVAAGDLGANATVAAKLRQAQDAAGTGAKDIAGKAITTIDGTESPPPANVQAVLSANQEDLDNANAFTHIQLSLTVATATSDVAAFLFGVGCARIASDFDAASVVEYVPARA